MKEVKEFNIDVPMTLHGITLRQYQQWIKIVKKYDDNDTDDENYLKVKMLQIFCNLPIEDTYKIPLHNFDNIVTHISKLFNEEQKLTTVFYMEGEDNGDKVELGMIPDLHKMSFGEYVDLDKYINSYDDMHKAMAILYRPVTFRLKDTYSISDYKGTAKTAEVMLDMPVDIVMGAVNFMTRLTRRLVKHTLVYSHKEMTEEMELAYKQTLDENGDGINPFILSLKKTQLESMKPLS